MTGAGPGAAARDRELARLRDALADLDDTHAFTVGRTGVHIGAEQAQAMQEAYEQERAELRARIAELEHRAVTAR